MGSRKQPNWGGGGKYRSRKYCNDLIAKPQKPIDKDIKSEPFNSLEEVMVYVGSDKIRCLICNEEYIHLGNHVARAHGVKADDYKMALNIPLYVGLMGATVKSKLSDTVKK